MSVKKIFFVFILFWISNASFAQFASVRGVILDANNKAVGNVNISCSGVRTQSNATGFYQIKIPANQKETIVFTHISLKKATAFCKSERERRARV